MKPLISVIIPSYNVEKYLADACNSVIEQTYSKWEALIIDDGSTDKTSEIAKEYCNKNERFKYIYKENAGLSAARKTGIYNCKGEFIQFLDADDILLPTRFETLLKEYTTTEINVILYTDFWVGLDDSVHGKRITSSRPIGLNKDLDFDDLYFPWHQKFLFVPACLFFKREHFENIKYDSSLRAVEDWDLYLSLASSGYKFRPINNKLVVYRNNPDGLSTNNSLIRHYFYTVLNKWRFTTNQSRTNFFKKCGIEYSNQLFKYIFNKEPMLGFPIVSGNRKWVETIINRVKISVNTLIYLLKRIYALFVKQFSKMGFTQ